MKLSFKRIISILLFIAMVATSTGFNTFAVSLGDIVNVEVKKNQEKNKENSYKYYYEMNKESNQLLMKGDEEDSIATANNENSNENINSNDNNRDSLDNIEVIIEDDEDIQTNTVDNTVFGTTSKDIKVGDYVIYGKYEQDNVTNNGKEDIEWLVLDVDEKTGKTFLISKKALFVKYIPYKDYETYADKTDLRNYLNKDFYNDSFTNNEKLYIVDSQISVPGNSNQEIINHKLCWGAKYYYQDSAGNKKIKEQLITDKIFILSYDEVIKYFDSEDDRIAENTVYSVIQADFHWSAGIEIGLCYWLTRSMSTVWGYRTTYHDYGCAPYVDPDGTISFDGSYYSKNNGSFIRPAMWLTDGAPLTKVGHKEGSGQNDTYSKITWEIGEGSKWADTYTAIDSYIEGSVTELPTNDDISRTGYTLDGWFINNSTATYREIPASQTGDITLTANWIKIKIESEIEWILDGGKFKDAYKYYETKKYTEGEDMPLPGAETLEAPYRKTFNYWSIDGKEVTKISKETKGTVVVKANWSRVVDNFESVSIGKYQQNNDEETTEIEWLVLDKIDDKVLLITKNVIDNQSYDTNGNANFANSSIKEWLNNEFYNNAFTDKQKENICDTYITSTEKSKVFLLSEMQADDYFENDILRVARATDYAKEVDNDGEKLAIKSSKNCQYWLMTTNGGNKAPYVSFNGVININGISTKSKDIGVRPVIWIKESKIDDMSLK